MTSNDFGPFPPSHIGYISVMVYQFNFSVYEILGWSKAWRSRYVF